MVPVALFFLSIRHGVGGGARMGRIAGWAALASILAFLVYNFSAGQRRYVVVMVGALAALLLPEARPAPLGAQPRASRPWWP